MPGDDAAIIPLVVFSVNGRVCCQAPPRVKIRAGAELSAIALVIGAPFPMRRVTDKA